MLTLVPQRVPNCRAALALLWFVLSLNIFEYDSKAIAKGKGSLLPAPRPLLRLLGLWSKLPSAIFVACCLVFCLQTEVAMLLLPFHVSPYPRGITLCADALSFVLHRATWLSAQDSSGWGLATLHLQTLCEFVSQGYQYLLWRKTSVSARLLLLCSESLRSQSFHTLTCSSYLHMEPH